jgi:hypothetical protein
VENKSMGVLETIKVAESKKDKPENKQIEKD